ncbi:MAG: hypothetical protein MSIBF_04900 [Candidatus Altiarchaeales archaeon IMC4]|nr:MAG: hypothetical protein MSIBF_04900 [Candidatus Altiarchaeales archaeon IMC4]
MRINELSIDGRFIKILEDEGISELYPPQEDAVKAGLLDGGNFVLCNPTASGKTLIAELAIAKTLEAGSKAVYVVPLRALAYEKYTEFRKYEKLGYRVELQSGDLDSSKYKRLEFDILIATAEKCDSMLRSRPEFFDNVRLLVMDEVHLITTDRGPVYEIIIARLTKKVRILALSATIGNPNELADWLDGKLVTSLWRPVKLAEEVRVGEKIDDTINKSLAGGGQTLVFVNSRASAESVAEKLGEGFGAEKNAGLSEEILKALPTPTKQCKRLAKCVKHGTAFHHAGITGKQRVIIEDAFKAGKIKVIAATPTLAAGVNLPSRTVVIRDVKRFGGQGMDYIPVLEYKQMVGRAGRPKYDKTGSAVLLAKNESEGELLAEKYIRGKPEHIHSMLGAEPVLRFHVLAAVASSMTTDEESLAGFFHSTFFGHQYGVGHDFRERLNRVIEQLVGWDFIQRIKSRVLPTNTGMRVSELYIDPLTAYKYIYFLTKAEMEGRFPVIGLLEVLCDSSEMRPLVSLKRGEDVRLWEKVYSDENQFFRRFAAAEFGFRRASESELEMADWEFLSRFKTAKAINDWMCEKSEDAIMEAYGVTPGILYQKLRNAEWLAYSASELAKIVKLKTASSEAEKLRVRIKHGIKEELLPLVAIKGIGRVKARKLFNAGFKTPAEIKSEDLGALAEIIGEKTAENVLAEN